MEQVPRALAEASILTTEEETVSVAELWRDRPAVLVFVRQFG